MFLKIFLLLALVEGIMWNICVTLFKILARGFGDVTLHGGGGGGGGGPLFIRTISTILVEEPLKFWIWASGFRAVVKEKVCKLSRDEGS